MHTKIGTWRRTQNGDIVPKEEPRRALHTQLGAPCVDIPRQLSKVGSFASSGMTSPSCLILVSLYHKPPHCVTRKSPGPKGPLQTWKPASLTLSYSVHKHLCAGQCIGSLGYKRQKKGSQSLRNSQFMEASVCTNNDTIKIQCGKW